MSVDDESMRPVATCKRYGSSTIFYATRQICDSGHKARPWHRRCGGTIRGVLYDGQLWAIDGVATRQIRRGMAWLLGVV